jgi:DNA-binding MarR family transcriptional regulator
VPPSGKMATRPIAGRVAYPEQSQKSHDPLHLKCSTRAQPRISGLRSRPDRKHGLPRYPHETSEHRNARLRRLRSLTPLDPHRFGSNPADVELAAGLGKSLIASCGTSHRRGPPEERLRKIEAGCTVKRHSIPQPASHALEEAIRRLAWSNTCIYTHPMRSRQSDTADYMATAACYCLASRQAARKITRLYDSLMQESGIRATQFTILSQLMLRGAMPVGKLAGFLGMERTTLTRNLVPLETQKWISAKPGEDPRARVIAITTQGRGVVRRSFPHWAKAQAEAGKLLGADGQAALKVLGSRTLE